LALQAPSAPRSTSENKSVLADAVVQSAAPEWLKPYLKGVGPIFSKLGTLLDLFSPLWITFQKTLLNVYKFLEPYDPDELLTMFFGFICIFFGGFFMTTIACVEAFRITGWERVKNGVTILWEDYKVFKKASDEDDSRDEDGDGIPDVQQIPSQDLITRKLNYFL